jgi:hypothetical protein
MSNPFNPWKEIDGFTQKGRSLRTLSGVANRTPGVGLVNFSGQVVDADTVTITLENGTEFVFEFDDNATFTAGNIQVDITANGSASDDADDLATAVNTQTGDTGIVAYRSSNAVDEQVLLVAQSPSGIAHAVAEAATNVTVQDAVGDVNHGSPRVTIAQRAPTAQEVTQGIMHFTFAHPVDQVFVTVQNGSTFAAVAWDGAAIRFSDENRVEVDNDGSTDWTTAHLVTVMAVASNVDGSNDPAD